MSVFCSYSRYYNLFYRDKDYAGETTYIEKLIQKYHPQAETILDLGCGTGRHDFLLADKGYDVTGVDRSAEMLSVAKARLTAQALSSSSPEFHQGDIRTIRLGKTFDLVVSLFHVFSYQTGNDDLRNAFATARKHLKPGGIFIFDFWYGPAVLTDRPVVRVKRLEDENIVVTRIAEPVMQANDNLVEVNYQVLVKDKKSGAVEELHEVHRMRYLFYPEIERFVQEAGMTILDASEWMTGRTPDFDTWGVYFVVRG